MRWKKRWMILGALGLLLALIADGVLLGVSLINRWGAATIVFIAFIPLLSISYGALWFLTMTDGGVRIYGKCCLSFTEDGKIKARCERTEFLNSTELGKTLSPKGIIEHKGFYVVLGEKRDWLALPGDAPIDRIRELVK